MKTMVHIAFLLILISPGTSQLYGQGLTLLTTGGGYGYNGDLHLAYSVGEPLVQYTLINSVWLTEGFQQPDEIDLTVGTGPHTVLRDITVYPNPATSSVIIAGDDLSGCKTVTLSNLLGQPLITTNITGNGSHMLTLDDLYPGLFIITVQCAETQYRSQSIIKL